MMGERRVMQEALFYGFSLERHVPDNHLLRKIDRFVDLTGLRAHLGPYYSDVGRPSIDPSRADDAHADRRLRLRHSLRASIVRRGPPQSGVPLVLSLGLDGDVPDHSTFSKNRHGRFRESDLLRKLFETVVARCMKERIAGGELSQSTPALSWRMRIEGEASRRLKISIRLPVVQLRNI